MDEETIEKKRLPKKKKEKDCQMRNRSSFLLAPFPIHCWIVVLYYIPEQNALYIYGRTYNTALKVMSVSQW